MPTVDDFDLDSRTSRAAAPRSATARATRSSESSGDATRATASTAAGADVLYEEHPGGHHIDPRFLGGLPDWLAETVPSG